MTRKSISDAACVSAMRYGKNGCYSQTLRSYEAIEYRKRSLFSGLQGSLISRPMQIRTDDEVKLICDIIAALLYTNDGSSQLQQRLEQLETELDAYDRRYDQDGNTRSPELCTMLMERYGTVKFFEESADIPYSEPTNFLYALHCGKYFLPEKEVCCMQGKPYGRQEEHNFEYEEDIMPF